MDEHREESAESGVEPRVERETTIINTGGGGQGSGGLIAAVLLILVLAVIAFLVFGRGLGGGSDTKIDIDVKAPDIDMPDVDLPTVPAGDNKSK